MKTQLILLRDCLSELVCAVAKHGPFYSPPHLLDQFTCDIGQP
jgi:hypothetical protein